MSIARVKWCMIAVLAAGVSFGALAQAASGLKAARERRKARQAQIVRIVKADEATEGADGFLTAKSDLPAAKAELVKAENADRRTGYEAIAKANGKSVEEIGKKAGEINRARAKK